MEMLDFNALQQPTWPVKLRDKDQTVVTLVAPSVETYDRLLAAAPKLEAVAQEKNAKAIRAVFDLVADIMSANDDGLVFTAEELRDKYRMSMVDVFKFVAGYMQFIKEIESAKN